MMITAVWIAAGWISGWFLLRGIVRLGAGKEDGYSAAEPSQHTPVSISVIIPARNEEKNIGCLLASLAKQDRPPDEVIVADDGSLDQTAAIARFSGAKVIQPGELPAGWLGKSWACWRGAQEAQGDILVFLDADTFLEPEGILRLSQACLRTGGLVSVQPYHSMRRLYERLSAFFNVIVIAGVGGGRKAAAGSGLPGGQERGHAEESVTAGKGGGRAHASGAFGPCAACLKEIYFQAGGHEAVRTRILENHALGLVFSGRGLAVSNFTGRGTIHFRMYPDGLGNLLAGWSKSFASGAAATSRLRLLLVILWIAGAVSACTCWFGAADSAEPGLLAAASALYLLYAAQLYVLFNRAGNFGPAAALVFPVPLFLFMIIFLQSAIHTFFRGRVDWKGRSILTGKERG